MKNLIGFVLVVVGVVTVASSAIGPMVSSQFHYSGWAIGDMIGGIILMAIGVKILFKPQNDGREYAAISAEAISAAEKIATNAERERFRRTAAVEREASEEMFNIGISGVR